MTDATAAPATPRRPVATTRHGDTIEDPYGWLRDREDPDVIAWLEANNTHTDAVLAPLADLRERLFEELRARVVETDASSPVVDGPWAWYHRTVEGSDYAIHCRRPADARDARWPVDPQAPPADEQVVLDENVLAEGHDYLGVGGLATSPDHRLLAYLVDTDGDERYELRIRAIDGGQDLETVVADASYGLAWAADSEHLFYVRPDDAWRPHQVWRHRLGTDASHDVLVLQEDDERYWLGLSTTRTEDLVVITLASKSTSEVHLVDAHDVEAPVRVVAPRRDGVEYHVDHDRTRDRLVILSNVDDAVDFQVLTAPLSDLGSWTTLVAHRPGIRIEDLDALAGHLLLSERTDARTQVRVCDPATGQGEVVPTAEAAITLGVGAIPTHEATTVRLHASSLTLPPTTYDRDLTTGHEEVIKQVEVPGYQAGHYVSERLEATSADGTAVPISMVRRRDTPLDGSAPCLLYGYGAYEMSSDPTFRAWRVSLLDRGGVFAIAHVRGGGEMGRGWYEAGRFGNKPNTFDDFAACADHLVETGVTSRDRLAIEGGSAGGLLVGATLNLRPDLCAAAIAVVPFVDVLNTMSDPTLPLTIPEYEEWGSPEEPSAYADIRGYSPYENVRAEAYPAMLVTGGLNDPRVSYWEPAKWVARLREVTTGEAPILLKTEMGAGHAGPSGRYDAWRERALFAAFAIDRTGAPHEPLPYPRDGA